MDLDAHILQLGLPQWFGEFFYEPGGEFFEGGVDRGKKGEQSFTSQIFLEIGHFDEVRYQEK